MNIFGTITRKVGGAVDIVRGFLRGNESVDGLDIYGREEFRAAVAKALMLLRDKRMPAWDTLTQHVGSIFEGTRTTIIVTAHPALMLIDAPRSRQDLEHLAGTITHLAFSCQLHRTHESEHPGRRVPRDIYSGSAAQALCNKAYRECVLALGGAPEGPEGTLGSRDPQDGA